MNLKSNFLRRAAAVSSAVFVSGWAVATLVGCSSGPAQIAGPSRAVVGSAPAAFIDEPSEVSAPPVTSPPLIHSKSPRLHVWTDDWRGVRDQGISLSPDHIHDLVVPAGEAVTFSWFARAMAGQQVITGYRWALDLLDISDETIRVDENDLSHWSTWNASETSVSVGPFGVAGGTHVLSVEARDSRGFLSLVTIRLIPDGGEGLSPTRR